MADHVFLSHSHLDSHIETEKDRTVHAFSRYCYALRVCSHAAHHTPNTCVQCTFPLNDSSLVMRQTCS